MPFCSRGKIEDLQKSNQRKVVCILPKSTFLGPFCAVCFYKTSISLYVHSMYHGNSIEYYESQGIYESVRESPIFFYSVNWSKCQMKSRKRGPTTYLLLCWNGFTKPCSWKSIVEIQNDSFATFAATFFWNVELFVKTQHFITLC